MLVRMFLINQVPPIAESALVLARLTASSYPACTDACWSHITEMGATGELQPPAPLPQDLIDVARRLAEADRRGGSWFALRRKQARPGSDAARGQICKLRKMEGKPPMANIQLLKG